MVPACYLEKYGDPTENGGFDSHQRAPVENAAQNAINLTENRDKDWEEGQPDHIEPSKVGVYKGKARQGKTLIRSSLLLKISFN